MIAESSFQRCRVTLSAVAALGVGLAAGRQPAPAVIYATEQAAAGRAAYQVSCAGCHQIDLRGSNEAPPLAGGNFMNTWRSRTTRDLFEYMQATMPPDGANLTADRYLAITAYILQANGAAAGPQAFTTTTAVPIGSVATGQAPASTSAEQAAARDPRTAQAQLPAPPPRGLTVTGEVKHYVPVTDEMLRNPDPGDWLMVRRNYQA